MIVVYVCVCVTLLVLVNHSVTTIESNETKITLDSKQLTSKQSKWNNGIMVFVSSHRNHIT